MEEFFPTLLLDLLVISITFSIILMALIQKIKSLSFIKKSWQVWLLNLFFSFSLGIPFSITFYNISLKNSIWVGLFSFIGASSIYEALKNQNIINYTPSSISDTITISKSNEIKRDI
jgi:hypothetical protein